MSETKEDKRKGNSGGSRAGSGRKPKQGGKVGEPIAIRLTESEALLLAIVADGEKMTHRQILMAGVKALMSKSVAEVLPPGGVEKLKSL